jgi:RecJ-like exonuclease
MTPEETTAQLEAMRALIGQPADPGDLTDTALDPNAPPSWRCPSCSGTGQILASRADVARFPEVASWLPGHHWGAVDCRACEGTGLREGYGPCDDCREPVFGSAICDTCAARPRCRTCACLLDSEAPDGSLCDDCQRQARLDFDINLGDS